MPLETKLFKHDYRFNKKESIRLILKIRHSGSESVVKTCLERLFVMLKSVVLKNVTNYIKLCSNSELHDETNRDEVITDCFLILSHCVNKFDISLKDSSFALYYNKSLNTNLYRRFEKLAALAKKKNVYVDSEMMAGLTSHSSDRHPPEMEIEFLFDQLKFTPIERIVMNSKMEQVSLPDLFERHSADFPDLKKSYPIVWASIKNKVKQVQHEL